MTALDILANVRTRIITTGWCKGSVGPKKGPNCLVGALEHEVPDAEWNTVGRIAHAALRAAAGVTALVAWNDAQIGVGNVLAVIDKAITQLKEASP